MSVVSARYLSTDWGDNVGTIQIVLKEMIMWHNWTNLEIYKPTILTSSKATDTGECDASSGAEPSLYKSSNSGNSDYCEVSYDSYLTNFQLWRVNEAPDHDNAQLFSYYDFYSSVVGYASLPGMCITYNSGGVNQCTYSTSFDGHTVARECLVLYFFFCTLCIFLYMLYVWYLCLNDWSCL